MKSPARTIALVVIFALCGATGADDAPRSQLEPPAAVNANDTKVWAQTRLIVEPPLRQQIERTEAFLDENAARIHSEMLNLKTEGILDRRSTTKIRSALSDARRSMTKAEEGLSAEEPIDGWTARMISYDLGMVADTLAAQADPLKAAPSIQPKGGREEPDGLSAVGEQRLDLAKTLQEGTSLLRETAQAIVRHLK
jgi:hypothetical protein